MRTYGAGSPVFVEGDPAECLYLLVEGRIRLSRMVSGEDVVDAIKQNDVMNKVTISES